MDKIYPKTQFVGQNTEYLPSCQSTNDVAADFIARGSAFEGLLMYTDHQTAGRGQRGNHWEGQPAMNLMSSVVLRPTFLAATEQFWLNMAVSLAVADTFAPWLSADDLRVKWPNDVFVGDKKLGGILIENVVQGQQLAWSVIGVGLNINQTEFAVPTATSLQQVAPQPGGHDRAGLLATYCERLEARYLQLRTGNRETLRAEYLTRLYRFGEEQPFRTDTATFRGRITGVDALGRLAIETEGTLRYFAFKEVQFVL